MPLLAVAQPPMDMERMLHQVCITITTITIIIAIIATNRHCAELCHLYHQHLCHLEISGVVKKTNDQSQRSTSQAPSMNGAQLALVLKVTQHHESDHFEN